MAFYAELKRRQWYCICGENQIMFYRKHLYDKWYNSFTDGTKDLLEKARKRRREQKEKEALEALNHIEMITNTICKYTDGFYINERVNGKSILKDLISIIKEK